MTTTESEATPLRIELSISAAVIAGCLTFVWRYLAGGVQRLVDLLPLRTPVLLLSAVGRAVALALFAVLCIHALRRLRERFGGGAPTLLIALVAIAALPAGRFVVTEPIGLQTLLEVGLPVALLFGLSIVSRTTRRASGATRVPEQGFASISVVVPFAALLVALSGDYHRFAVFSAPVRPYLVALIGIASALTAGSVLCGARNALLRGLGAAVLIGVALVLIWFDVTRYRRLYPELHLAAWLGGTFALARAGMTVQRLRAGRLLRRPVPAVAVLVACGVAGVLPTFDTRMRFELYDGSSVLGSLTRTLGIDFGTLFLPRPPVVYDVLGGNPGRPAAPRGNPPAARPSLLLICFDALRADHVTAEGMPATTHFLESSAHCLTARTAEPSTHPTMRALFSGTYPGHPTARVPGTDRLPDAALFWNTLRATGYRTEYVGGLKKHDYLAQCFDRTSAPDTRSDEANARILLDRLTELDADDAPFAVMLHLDAPHSPYVPVAPSIGTDRERYDACVGDTDAAAGLVYERLEAVARDRPLLVVLFSDHGEEFGEHGGRFHGTTVYDEQARVLLAFRGPGVRSGEHSTAVSLVDVAPTVLELLGFDVPAGFDGRSLVPLFDGIAVSARPIVTDVIRGGVHLQRGVTCGPYKLIANYTSGTLEVYDLRADPHERDNRLERLDDVPAEARALLGLR